MIKCSECGYENLDGLDYCDSCGAKLVTAEKPAAGGEPPKAEEAAAERPAAGAAVEAGAPAPETQEPSHDGESEAPTGELQPKPAAAEPQPAAAPAAAAAPFKAKFVVVRGGRKGHEFPLEEGNNQIGRWDPDTGAFPEVDLDADDPEAKISRRHALVRIDGGKITIEDIGSLNGTYVNRGPRLQPGNPVELKSGDEVIVGKTFLKLVVEPIS
jgi:hypothetical protein